MSLQPHGISRRREGTDRQRSEKRGRARPGRLGTAKAGSIPQRTVSMGPRRRGVAREEGWNTLGRNGTHRTAVVEHVGTKWDTSDSSRGTRWDEMGHTGQRAWNTRRQDQTHARVLERNTLDL